LNPWRRSHDLGDRSNIGIWLGQLGNYLGSTAARTKHDHIFVSKIDFMVPPGCMHNFALEIFEAGDIGRQVLGFYQTSNTADNNLCSDDLCLDVDAVLAILSYQAVSFMLS
jgi:hypothetical protein